MPLPDFSRQVGWGGEFLRVPLEFLCLRWVPLVGDFCLQLFLLFQHCPTVFPLCSLKFPCPSKDFLPFHRFPLSLKGFLFFHRVISLVSAGFPLSVKGSVAVPLDFATRSKVPYCSVGLPLAVKGFLTVRWVSVVGPRRSDVCLRIPLSWK